MSDGAAFLLVRAGTRRVGLSIGQVVEVVEPGRIYPVPSLEPAVRGVATVRGRIVPVIHLGAFLEGTSCPPNVGSTGVVLIVEERCICLEVEEAESVLRESGMPVPPGTTLPWAAGVARHAGELVPLLDLGALASTLAPRFSEAQSA